MCSQVCSVQGWWLRHHAVRKSLKRKSLNWGWNMWWWPRATVNPKRLCKYTGFVFCIKKWGETCNFVLSVSSLSGQKKGGGNTSLKVKALSEIISSKCPLKLLFELTIEKNIQFSVYLVRSTTTLYWWVLIYNDASDFISFHMFLDVNLCR